MNTEEPIKLARATTGTRAGLAESKITYYVQQLGYVEETKAIDATMAKVSGNSRYYKLLLAQGSLYMLALGFVLYAIGFLNCLPNFTCPDGPDGKFVKVPEVEACKRLDVCRVSYPYHGWVENYNMICEQRNSRVFYTSLIFFINAVVFFSLNSMSDLLGRNFILKATTLVAVGGTVAIWLVDNYIAKILTIGLVTGTTSVSQMMFTLGLKESTYTATKYNIVMNAFLNVAFTASPIFVALLAIYFTNFNPLTLVCLCILAVFSIPNFFFYIETPLYLYRKKKGRDFIDKMHDLSERNQVKTTKKSLIKHLLGEEHKFKVHQPEVVIHEEHEPQTPIKKPRKQAETDDQVKNLVQEEEPDLTQVNVQVAQVQSVLPEACKEEASSAQVNIQDAPAQLNNFPEACKEEAQQQGDNNVLKESSKVNYKRLSWITIVLCYWTSSLYLINYGTLTSLDKSGMDNIYLNAILFGISNMCGYGISLKLPKDSNRINTMTWISVSLLLSGIAVLLLDIFAKSSSYSPVLQSASTVGLMPILASLGFAVLYLYLPDAYPVTLRGVGIGIVICLGKVFGGVGSPYIANWMLQQGYNPIAGLTVPSLLLLVLLRTIPAR